MTDVTSETICEFMQRIWTQDKATISDADYSTLISLAIIGAQKLAAKNGPTATVPSNG
jgi:hypothetical protein